MEEVWKPVVGYEGFYEVSNLGRVKRLETRVNSNVGGRTVRERILKNIPTYQGYLKVHLCVDNKRIKKNVHRLVAEAFIPNPNNLPCINHRDENKTNNTVWNLEWCDVLYNNTYGTMQARGLKTRYEKYYNK